MVQNNKKKAAPNEAAGNKSHKPAPKKPGPTSPPKKRTDSKTKKAKNLRWWRRPEFPVTPEQAEQMDCAYNEFQARMRLFMEGKTVLTAQEARESKRICGQYNERLAAIIREEPKTEPQSELEAVINDPPLLRQPGATGGKPLILVTANGEPQTEPIIPIVSTSPSPNGAEESQDPEEEADEETEPRFECDPPVLDSRAYLGLPGAMANAIEPELEAHPAAYLAHLLTIFGNVVGRGAWFNIGEMRHYPVLFVATVGPKGSGKEGAYQKAIWPFRQPGFAEDWFPDDVLNGIGSAEGLIEELSYAEEIDVLTQQIVVKDQRRLLRLSELSVAISRGRKAGGTLSSYLRSAFDGVKLDIPNRRRNTSNLHAHGYSLSICSDTQPGAIRRILQTGTESIDGWASRFLWCYTARQRYVPTGGNIDVLLRFLDPLRHALDFASEAGAIHRDNQAEQFWNDQLYRRLFDLGAQTMNSDRARAYVLRLSMLYALMNCSTVISLNHLGAALALWKYCYDSASLLFGEAPDEDFPTGPILLWQRVLDLIRGQPGITRTEIHHAFKRNLKAEYLTQALEYLERSGKARREKYNPARGGPQGEHWYAI